MTPRTAALRRATGLIRRGWLLTVAATVVVGALVAPAAVGIWEQERADARAEGAAFATALQTVQAILDEDRGDLDRLLKGEWDQSAAPRPALPPNLRAAVLFDASGTPVAAVQGGLGDAPIAALGEAAAREVAAHPEQTLVVVSDVADDDRQSELAALARPWADAGGLSGGIAAVVLDRDALSALHRLSGAALGGQFDLLTADGAPLFGGGAAVAGARQQPIAGTPLFLRYLPTGKKSAQLWRVALPFLVIAIAGLAAAAGLAIAVTRHRRLLHREIERRIRIERRLRDELTAIAAAVGRTDELNAAKSRFFAHVTHELRTPLNAILGFTETIRQEMFGPIANPRYREYAGLIHDASSHLLSLTNDLLDTAQIENGKMPIAPIRVSAAAAARSALDIVELLAAEKEIELESPVPAGCPDLNVDPRAMKQVLVNLLSNAIKYTPRGGRIELRFAARDGGGATIEVADTGAGMSAEDVFRAFEPFGRAATDQARRQPGTGLGLSLARALVRLHGGDLTLTSRVGVGTTATVTLPESAVFAAPTVSATPSPVATIGAGSAARAA